MVTLRRATHDVLGRYRHDWTRADVPISDERLRTLHGRLRAINEAYVRQADNLARFDRWLTKRLTGGDVPSLMEAGLPEETEAETVSAPDATGHRL